MLIEADTGDPSQSFISECSYRLRRKGNGGALSSEVSSEVESWTPGSVRISQEHACGGGREISDGLRTTDDWLSMRGAIDGSASRVLNQIWFETGGTLL